MRTAEQSKDLLLERDGVFALEDSDAEHEQHYFLVGRRDGKELTA